MAAKIRWGILGTGNIAKQFARGLQVVKDARLVAVGSRAADTANSFGDAFDVPNRHDSYEALAADPDVDAIYVSTPHPFHAANTILCLNAGKAVLCEKPFTINAAEAAKVISLARRKKLFLMEAMWTRFVPAVIKTRELLEAGAIGEPRMLFSDFGYAATLNPKWRHFDPALGGGALLDVGVYPISFSSMIFGTPVKITGGAHLGITGVDEQSAYVLQGKAGQLSLLSSAIRTNTPQETTIMGTEGRIRLHSPSWRPSKLTLSRAGKPDKDFDLPFKGNGYNYEAVEVMACMRAGKLESEVMPLDETISIMKTMDTLRAQWNFVYPSEK